MNNMGNITITFYNFQNNKYIKQWYWLGVIPVVGDYVVLHFGDYNEEEATYKVMKRIINGLKSDSIDLYVLKV